MATHNVQRKSELERENAYGNNHRQSVRSLAETIVTLDLHKELRDPDDTRRILLDESLALWATINGITDNELTATKRDFIALHF